MFPLFRHADEGDARLIQWFVWGCVQSVKLRSNSFQSFLKYLFSSHLFFFFCNLVHKNDLLAQYPEATSLIKELPASLDDKCFKQQAPRRFEGLGKYPPAFTVVILMDRWAELFGRILAIYFNLRWVSCHLLFFMDFFFSVRNKGH